MKLYRFSPIETNDQFSVALEYLSHTCTELAALLTGASLTVPILKLFAHTSDEYRTLEQLVRIHGQQSKMSSGTSLYVKVEDYLTINQQAVKLLGVRKPDPYRFQVGCGDYMVEDFQSLAQKLTREQPEFVRPIYSEHNMPMLELWHPDIDVLGYIIPKRHVRTS